MTEGKPLRPQDDGSRMSRESHVRYCEGVGVKFPCATHAFSCPPSPPPHAPAESNFLISNPRPPIAFLRDDSNTVDFGNWPSWPPSSSSRTHSVPNPPPPATPPTPFAYAFKSAADQ